LEITNDSMNLSKSISKKAVSKKIVQVKKPSRMELLKEWRSQKIKQKITVDKSKRVPFVVKHIVYKDSKDKVKNSRKENVELDKKGKKSVQEKNSTDRTQRVLGERNPNLNTNTVKDTFKKQSYSDWKKSQPAKATQDPIKKVNQTTRKTKPVLKNQAKTESQTNTKSRPVTRSMRSSTKKNELSDKKSTTVKSKKIVPRKEAEEEEKNEGKENITDTENNKSEIEEAITSVEHSKENDECLETESTEKAEDTEEEQVTIETVPLMTEKTDFEPPEIFNTFKFNQKAIFESIQDFIPTNSNPAEAKLFTTVIPEILEKENDLDKSVNQEKMPCVPLGSKTPVAVFKERQGLVDRKTPTSTPKRLTMSAKRASLTPNPNNFLHKIEDPIAVRTETPKSRRSLNLGKKEETPVAETVESESVKHFTNLVANEEEKFKKSVTKWEKVLEDKIAPEEHHGNILAAIGQAQLFRRKRFNQFKELIELHKDKSAEKAAHASDLDGFWEMIFYQVEDVHKRFEELDQLQNRGWIVDEPEVAKKPVVKKAVKVVKPKKVESKTKTAATNSKKSDFAKFRKQMMAKKKSQQVDTNETVEILEPSKPTEKTVEFEKTTTTTTIPEVETITEACLQPSSCSIQPTSTTKLAAPSPARPVPVLSPAKGPIESVEPPTRPSTRRSTRKTPSKYSSINFQTENKKPEDVACKLFEGAGEDKENEAPEQDFTKYLSKTLTEEGHPVQRDLLTSFDTSTQPPVPACVGVAEDLMVFASPLPTTRSRTLKEKSVPAETKPTEELLLL